MLNNEVWYCGRCVSRRLLSLPVRQAGLSKRPAAVPSTGSGNAEVSYSALSGRLFLHLQRRQGALEDGAEDVLSVGATQHLLAAPLRVGHHPQHVARTVHDSCDVVE